MVQDVRAAVQWLSARPRRAAGCHRGRRAPRSAPASRCWRPRTSPRCARSRCCRPRSTTAACASMPGSSSSWAAGRCGWRPAREDPLAAADREGLCRASSGPREQRLAEGAAHGTKLFNQRPGPDPGLGGLVAPDVAILKVTHASRLHRLRNCRVAVRRHHRLGAGQPAAAGPGRVAAPVAQSAPASQQPRRTAPAATIDPERVKALEAVAAQNPKDTQPRVQLGNMYFDAEQYAQSISWYEQAVALNPNDANVSTDLGVAYYYTNQPDRAMAQFDHSLSIDPKHIKTLLNIGHRPGVRQAGPRGRRQGVGAGGRDLARHARRAGRQEGARRPQERASRVRHRRQVARAAPRPPVPHPLLGDRARVLEFRRRRGAGGDRDRGSRPADARGRAPVAVKMAPCPVCGTYVVPGKAISMTQRRDTPCISARRSAARRTQS